MNLSTPSRCGTCRETGRPSRLPFAHLNLRFNPFGELPPAERAQLAVAELGDLPAWLAAPGRALQFTGSHGRGKTTHLLALYHQHFPQAAWTKLFPGDRPAFPWAAIQFVDSFDLLGWWRRRGVYRRSGTLAITTHTDLTGELRRAGYSVRTRQIGDVDAATLATLIDRRIEHARRGPGSVPTLAPGAVAELLARFGDDVRAIEAHLYDCFQHQQGAGHVQV